MNRLLLVGLLVALTGCAAPPKRPALPPGDAELGRTTRLARAAFDRGATQQALTLYDKALQRAHAMDDAQAIGDTAYNAAICAINLGDFDRARLLLDEAESEFRRRGSDATDVWLAQARLAQLQKQPERALELTGKITATSDPTALQVALLHGQIACDQHDTPRATAALAEAQKFSVTDPALQAGREQLTGRVRLLENKPGQAAEAFDREAGYWKAAQRYRPMAEALTRAAAAWRLAGNEPAAADRASRAQRSLSAQGISSR